MVWPGFDESFLAPVRSPQRVREYLGLSLEHLVITYPGNIHESNLADMQSLYFAISQLRRDGYAAVLVRTGWDFVHRSALPTLRDGLIELGWVARAHVPELIAAADVLVQPGRSDMYNDYRFPSKIPEFLASGRPVVLPRTNVGLHLRDGTDALILDSGDPDEICAKVKMLAADPELASRVGEAGRAFALRELRWQRSVARITDLYQSIARPEVGAASSVG